MLQVEEVDHLLGLLARTQLGFAHRRAEKQVLPKTRLAVRVAANQEVVQHRGVLKQLDILKSARNAQRRHVLRCLRGQLDHALRSLVVNLARGGRVDAADQVEHRGLARAIGPDQREHFARFNVKAHVVDGQHAAKAHAQILGG